MAKQQEGTAVTSTRGGAVTIAEAADAFLSSPRAASPNTRRAYAGVLDRLAAELGPHRQLAAVPGDEIAGALRSLWGASAPATWNRNRAAVVSWLIWCAQKKRWPAPQLPPDAERRKESNDATRALPRARVERLLSRRDIPLRGKTLWRMLYETAARASEILALDVEDLDLEQRRARPVQGRRHRVRLQPSPRKRAGGGICGDGQHHDHARFGVGGCGPERCNRGSRCATPAIPAGQAITQVRGIHLTGVTWARWISLVPAGITRGQRVSSRARGRP
jgi:hypothetical protein